MNITTRKLKMLQKIMKQKEEQARFCGYTTSPADQDLQLRIANLMSKIDRI